MECAILIISEIIIIFEKASQIFVGGAKPPPNCAYEYLIFFTNINKINNKGCGI